MYSLNIPTLNPTLLEVLPPVLSQTSLHINTDLPGSLCWLDNIRFFLDIPTIDNWQLQKLNWSSSAGTILLTGQVLILITTKLIIGSLKFISRKNIVGRSNSSSYLDNLKIDNWQLQKLNWSSSAGTINTVGRSNSSSYLDNSTKNGSWTRLFRTRNVERHLCPLTLTFDLGTTPKSIGVIY